MNGSRPKSPRPKPSRGKPPKLPKPRRSKPSAPWVSMVVLFMVYTVMGLVMSIPTPPYWVWIAIAFSIPLIVLGFNRPVMISGKKDRGGLMAYLGGLIMVIALAVSINYFGSENTFDDVRFFNAIAVLGALTLGAVLLTAIAAITSALAGTRLMPTTGYGRSISMVITTSFMGLCVGGVAGLAVTTLTTPIV
ncbi:MAG: hypothetical protein AAF528_04000 [Cyanobacteria bacterium P01_C01_bin.121]